MVVQGAVNPDNSTYTSLRWRRKRQAVVRRTMGSKKIRMIYARPRSIGERVRMEDVPQEQRDRSP
ncbi:hypothetical protein ACNKHS_09010 [Shigella flexneri]